MRWEERAACQGADHTLFFEPDYPKGRWNQQLDAQVAARTAEALSYCAKCDVRTECGELADREGFPGVWGGRLRRKSHQRDRTRG